MSENAEGETEEKLLHVTQSKKYIHLLYALPFLPSGIGFDDLRAERRVASQILVFV